MSKFQEEIVEPMLIRKIMEFLEEDLGSGDITTDAIINPDIDAEALITCNEKAVVSGVKEAVLTFNLLKCSAEALIGEGDTVEKGRTVLKVRGKAQAILKCERTALNILGRMSGVASLTSILIREAIKGNQKIRIAATRKTQPGFRVFDKKAVQSGGGDTHRFRLDDAVLIKDNHLKIIGSVTKAIELARKNVSFTKKIEVEATSIKEALEAAEAGADIVLLDNMKPEDVSKVINKFEERHLRNKVVLEASGGIGLSNIKKYSKTGVDVVSLGEMTHSAKNIDFSLEII